LSEDDRASVAIDQLRLASACLSDLIRIDTSGSPGGESTAARYLQSLLASAGINAAVHRSWPGRANLIARLPATPPPAADELQRRPGALLVITHLDCHPFDRTGWLYDPLGGVTADGAIWGRGAVNCKGPIAAWTSLLINLHRSGRPRVRDVVLVAAADGVGGFAHGLDWLYRHHGQALAADAAIAQGGGWPLRMCGQTYYAVNCAERGLVQVKVGPAPGKGQAKDRSPAAADQELLAVEAIMAAAERLELPVHLTPHFEAFVEALAATQRRPAASHIRSLLSPLITDQAARRLVTDPAQRAELLAGARNALKPHRLTSTGVPGRVVDQTEAVLSALLLPGQSLDLLSDELGAAMRKAGLPIASPRRPHGLRLQAESVSAATASPTNHELLAVIAAAVARRHPGATLAPITSGAPTSCRLPRLAGTPAYGFFPLTEALATIDPRAPNERMPLAGLAFALQVLGDVVEGYVVGR
jgi:acetylornithine deacetylase/succinyl-diaminopimelate desuccinylase-like protein